jgi:hypothetical protein
MCVELSARTREALTRAGQALREAYAKRPYRFHPDFVRQLKVLSNVRLFHWARLLNDPERSFSRPETEKLVPELYREFVRDGFYTQAVGPRPGGGFAQTAFVMLLPGVPADGSLDELRRVAGENGVGVTLKNAPLEPRAAPIDTPAYRAAELVLRDEYPTAYVMPQALPVGYTTSSRLRAAGIAAYGLSPFEIDVFEASTLHRPNETIQAVVFLNGVEAMRKIVFEFATGP